MAENSKPESRSGRWWENYVVRYFVGTVFGAGIAVFLTEYPASPLNGFLQKVAGVQGATFKDIAVFASIGFAICYVASAPILTLHTLREHMRVQRLAEHPLRWALAALVGAVIVWLCTTKWLKASPAVAIAVAATLIVILGCQVVLVVNAVVNKFVHVRAFYEGLSAARSSANGRAHEYVESYRHLREHGNAFLILLLEAALGFVLANVPDAESAVVVLVLWVLPATSAWFVGVSLEADFAYAPPPVKP